MSADNSLTNMFKEAADTKNDCVVEHTLDSGQRRLEELGYKQELQREFGILSSTCSGFASTSFLLTITGKPSTFPNSFSHGYVGTDCMRYIMVTERHICNSLTSLLEQPWLEKVLDLHAIDIYRCASNRHPCHMQD